MFVDVEYELGRQWGPGVKMRERSDGLGGDVCHRLPVDERRYSLLIMTIDAAFVVAKLQAENSQSLGCESGRHHKQTFLGKNTYITVADQ